MAGGTETLWGQASQVWGSSKIGAQPTLPRKPRACACAVHPASCTRASSQATLPWIGFSLLLRMAWKLHLSGNGSVLRKKAQGQLGQLATAGQGISSSHDETSGRPLSSWLGCPSAKQESLQHPAELWCHGGQPPSGLFNQGFGHCSDGGFLKWGGTPKTDGVSWKILLQRMIWGYPILGNPYMMTIHLLPQKKPRLRLLFNVLDLSWPAGPWAKLQSQPDAYVYICTYIYIIWLPPHVDPPHLYITCYCMYPIQLQYCNLQCFCMLVSRYVTN